MTAGWHIEGPKVPGACWVCGADIDALLAEGHYFGNHTAQCPMHQKCSAAEVRQIVREELAKVAKELRAMP